VKGVLTYIDLNLVFVEKEGCRKFAHGLSPPYSYEEKKASRTARHSWCLMGSWKWL